VNQGHVEEELLHRYFDGDLLAPQAATVAAHLQGCEDCSARHRELAELRRLIETSAEHGADGVDWDALYGRIEHGIREEKNVPSLSERLSVWGRDLVEQRPARLFVPLAVAAAIAFGLLAKSAMRSEEERAEQQKPVPTEQEQQEENAQGAPRLKKNYAVAEVSSEVVQVDFGGSAGTVYEVALAEGVSTPVVWINDDVQ
jgi:anti-sigma factor RsiW